MVTVFVKGDPDVVAPFDELISLAGLIEGCTAAEICIKRKNYG